MQTGLMDYGKRDRIIRFEFESMNRIITFCPDSNMRSPISLYFNPNIHKFSFLGIPLGDHELVGQLERQVEYFDGIENGQRGVALIERPTRIVEQNGK